MNAFDPQAGSNGRNILEAAEAHGIPLRSDPDLAAALAALEQGEEIPEELYVLVAEVLRFALSVKDGVGG